MTDGRARDDAGHHHVDVFSGPARKFVRGFTLLPYGQGWVVYDEIGLLGSPRALSDPLSLAQALKLALTKLHATCERPLRPVWGSAPFEVLGYRRPRWKAMLAAILRRPDDDPEIGPDGLPVS